MPVVLSPSSPIVGHYWKHELARSRLRLKKLPKDKIHFDIVVCVHFLVQTPSAYQGMCYEWKLFVKGANLHQFPISLTLWSNCAQKSKRMKTRSTFTAVSWLRLRHKWRKERKITIDIFVIYVATCFYGQNISPFGKLCSRYIRPFKYVNTAPQHIAQ